MNFGFQMFNSVDFLLINFGSQETPNEVVQIPLTEKGLSSVHKILSLEKNESSSFTWELTLVEGSKL